MSRYASWQRRLQEYSSLPAVVQAGKTFTYEQLLEQTADWTKRLHDQGVEPRQIIATCCDYSLSSISAMLAVFSSNAVLALIPPGGDTDHYIDQAKAQRILAFDPNGSGTMHPGPNSHAMSPLLDRLLVERSAGFIIFTSGSTSRPKAALHSVERFLLRFEKPGRRFRTLAFSSIDHIAGMDTLFYTLSSGGAVVITENRHPHSVLKLIERESVEVLPTSPSFLRILCATPEAGESNPSSLKIITYGSEPMDEPTLRRVNRRFPNADVLQKYGSTELGSPRTTSRGKDSLWIKFRQGDIETRVVDGVLWTRSDKSFLGYLNAPNHLVQDGWYCTGDMVEQDGEWIRFLGRQGDGINVGGQKVYPAEVESVIRELDFVHDAFVSGEPHALLGSIVSAQVAVLGPTLAGDVRQEIRAHCRRRLASYKVPIRLSIVDRIAVTTRQKRIRVDQSHAANCERSEGIGSANCRVDD